MNPATVEYLRNKIAVNLARRDPQENPWDWIMELVNRLANQHEPFFDLDDDNFSLVSSLRGSNWRGKDCDDLDANVHPGRTEGDDVRYMFASLTLRSLMLTGIVMVFMEQTKMETPTKVKT
jgi:hypothetical protein